MNTTEKQEHPTPVEKQPYTGDELVRLAWSVIGKMDVPEDLQEDAVQEFVLGALEAEENVTSPHGPRRYQYLRGHGRAVDFLRSAIGYWKFAPVSLHEPVTIKDEEYLLYETIPHPGAIDPSECEEIRLQVDLEHRRYDCLRDCFEELPEVEQEVIKRSILKGRSLEQIGEELDMTGNGVGKLKTRALKHLRELVEKTTEKKVRKFSEFQDRFRDFLAI